MSICKITGDIVSNEPSIVCFNPTRDAEQTNRRSVFPAEPLAHGCTGWQLVAMPALGQLSINIGATLGNIFLTPKPKNSCQLRQQNRSVLAAFREFGALGVEKLANSTPLVAGELESQLRHWNCRTEHPLSCANCICLPG